MDATMAALLAHSPARPPPPLPSPIGRAAPAPAPSPSPSPSPSPCGPGILRSFGLSGSQLSRGRLRRAAARNLPPCAARIGAPPPSTPRRAAWRPAPRLASESHSEAKVEEAAQELEQQAEESKAAYGETVDALKDETIKLQDSARGAHDSTAAKATEVLRDTTDKLRGEAEKARAILSATAAETAQLGKSNLNLLAESAPNPIKAIAETAVNAHLKENAKKGAKIHDFCLGIPYGAFLVAGGLLWFILSGSTAAIRFGVFLGGLLLFLSARSLKAWKAGNSSMRYIQGQAAVALIIFVNDAQKFFKTGAFFPPAVSALASGAMLCFYAYVYFSGGNPPKKEKIAEQAA